jgi:DNA-directed RNA polymerase II subunit RPB2
MTLDASGRLGIGTTSPIQKLQVAGNIALGSTSNGYLEAGSKYIGSSYASPGTDGFNGLQIEDISEVLKNYYNFNEFGDEILYNGMTGKQLKVKIFIGPTYYQRLKHMVLDKIHSRATGPLNILTRQPAEGRSRAGGLRAGEMERDCMIAHGMSRFLKERMMDLSDRFEMYLCKTCNMTIVSNPEQNIYYCKACQTKKYSNGEIYIPNICKIILPYSMKLLQQELQSMSISCKFITN